MSWEGKVVTLFNNLSIDEANKVIDEHRRNFEKTDGIWRCKKCGSASNITNLHVSTSITLIPFCPKCKGTPKMLRGYIR
jgi:Zn finger protein HypA/HybF involved in hydrogenase expression